MITDAPKKTRAQLSRQHWVNAARDVLNVEGVNGVHITRLARLLGVTRGSFYWHFRDRQALLENLLRDWKKRNTGIIVSKTEQAKSLCHGILLLFEIWEDSTLFDPKFDLAIREWARTDADIAKMVLNEDHQRLTAIAKLFSSGGFSSPDDYIRARILYFTQQSYYALDIQETAAQRKQNISSYVECYTGAPITEECRQAFNININILGQKNLEY